MSNKFGMTRFLCRGLGRCLTWLLVAVAGIALYLRCCGTPGWVLDDLLRAASRGTQVFKAESVTFDLRRGLTFCDVRMYRKGVPGPPAFLADEVSLHVDPWHIGKGLDCVDRVRIRNALLRPGLLARPKGSTSGGDGVSPDRRFEAHVEVTDCHVCGVDVQNLDCDLVVRGSSLDFQNLAVALSRGGRAGRLSGQLSFDVRARTLGGHLQTRIDPHVMMPWMQRRQLAFLQKLTRRFDFREGTPRAEVDFRQLCRPGGAFSLDGRFALGDCAYRGVDVLRADGEISVAASPTNTVVNISPFFLAREEGSAHGGFVVYPRQHLVEFDAVSTLNPEAGFHLMGVLTNLCPRTLSFAGPVHLEAGGVVDYRGLKETDFEVKAYGKDVSLWGFASEECEFRMMMNGPTNTIRDLRGTIYNGTFGGNVEFVVPTKRGGRLAYTVDARVTGAAFEEIVARRLDKDDQRKSSGALSGSVSVSGVSGPEGGRTASGEGSLRIDDGHVFMLPIFGGLSEFMAKYIPGLDFVLRQSDASADFTIADGKLHSDRIQIQGDVLSLTGKGDYHLDKQLDFYVQITLLKDHHLLAKLVRTVTYPISKLLEFRLTGTAGSPVWYPANFSPDLLERLGVKRRRVVGELP